MAHSKHWTTASILDSTNDEPNALIILNTPLAPVHLFTRIWQAATLRYCADGGANRLYDAFHSPRTEHSDQWMPDLIKGDLDSLRDDVRDYFASHGIPIEHDPDQDSTDLGKCLASLVAEEARQGREYQLILSGGLSGRLDQTAHTIHALTQLAEKRDKTWAVGRESLACVLAKGSHTLQIDSSFFGPTCAVLPFGQEAKVITKGQKWDLGPTAYAYPTSIAKFVSSSNQLLEETVEVETDVSVVWTSEVRDP